MPELTAKQRLHKLVGLFGAHEGLRRLLALDGVVVPGAAAGSGKPATGKPLELPSWITEERAAAIVQHFLHGELLLPWHLAPFWQDQWVAEEWPMVGAPAAPGWAQAKPPVPQAFETSPSAFAPSDPADEIAKATQVPVLPPLPPALWQTLVELYGDNVWLWAKYRKYFLSVAGKQPLLAGVLLAHEVDQGTISVQLEVAQSAAQVSPKVEVEVDCFAYTLAVAIGTLESLDFATSHNVMPKGYPSQWQAPEPPPTVWASPLHGDQRFWHEFDEPPVGDRMRYVRQGLTRQEAVRVWARRVAICLWGDANGHWGRWPWRLESTSLTMRRRLLGWDPKDPRLLSDATNPQPQQESVARYGLQNTATSGPGFGGPTGSYDAFGQAMWPDTTFSRSGNRTWSGRYLGYAVWDTNPYMAWAFSWHTSPSEFGNDAVQSTKADNITVAVRWMTTVFQSMGMWHGEGWLEAKPSLSRAHLPKYAGKSTQPKYSARLVPSNARVCSLAEVLDLNMGGCHTNGIVALSLLRAQCVPAAPSYDSFFGYGRATAADSVPGTKSEARFVPGTTLKADSDQAITGHLSLLAGFNKQQQFLQHTDRMLADRLGAFADPRRVWVPFEEHMLCLAALSNKAVPKLSVQIVLASHESLRTRQAIANAGKHWVTRRSKAELYDKTRSGNVAPFAMPRLGWYLAAERTLATDTIRGLKDGPWTDQADALFKDNIQSINTVIDPIEIVADLSAARRLAATLLGIDSKLVWSETPSAVKQTPAVLEPWLLDVYLQAAPWPRNYRFTSSVGQFAMNYQAGDGISSTDPVAIKSTLALALTLLAANDFLRRGQP